MLQRGRQHSLQGKGGVQEKGQSQNWPFPYWKV